MVSREDAVHTDAIAIIKMRADLYGGRSPRRTRLTGRLVSDLLQFGVKSVSAEAFGDWWLIVAKSDWLTIDLEYRVDRWKRISAAPEIGLEAMHPEVLLTAFSEVLFTIAKGSMDFIVGQEIGNGELTAKVQSLLHPDFRGRAVGFLIKE
jgi:hypothetical protein